MGGGQGFPISSRATGRAEKHELAYNDMLAAAGGRLRGRIERGSVEGPARDRTVGDRIIAFEHRHLGRGLLREPVPFVARPEGEALRFADAIVVDAVIDRKSTRLNSSH